MAPSARSRLAGCPFRCRCDSNDPASPHEAHHICSAGTCSCYGRDNHICGCSAMSCRRPGLTTPYNHVRIQKGYMSAYEPGQSNRPSVREPSDMVKYANVNAWMRRISLMFQKEEEMKAPGTTWYQELLDAPKHWSGAQQGQGAPRDHMSSPPPENDRPDMLHHSNSHADPGPHHRPHRVPMDPSKQLGKLWDQWNCSLHLRRVSGISRGSAACRLIDQHVHRRLTHHMLRHIVEVGRALPNDMEKYLYLEELMPPPVPILPPDDGDALDSNMRWSLLGTAAASTSNNKHNVYIPKRLKDATYADLLHISTARATNNAKRIAANVTAAADNRRALGPISGTGGALHSRSSSGSGDGSNDKHMKHKDLLGNNQNKNKNKNKKPGATNNKTGTQNIAAAALATSAFANMLVSSSTKVKDSADVIDALESAEYQLQCDALERGFKGMFTIQDIRSQMIVFLDEIMVGVGSMTLGVLPFMQACYYAVYVEDSCLEYVAVLLTIYGDNLPKYGISSDGKSSKGIREGDWVLHLVARGCAIKV